MRSISAPALQIGVPSKSHGGSPGKTNRCVLSEGRMGDEKQATIPLRADDHFSRMTSAEDDGWSDDAAIRQRADGDVMAEGDHVIPKEMATKCEADTEFIQGKLVITLISHH